MLALTVAALLFFGAYLRLTTAFDEIDYMVGAVWLICAIAVILLALSTILSCIIS